MVEFDYYIYNYIYIIIYIYMSGDNRNWLVGGCQWMLVVTVLF